MARAALAASPLEDPRGILQCGNHNYRRPRRLQVVISVSQFPRDDFSKTTSIWYFPNTPLVWLYRVVERVCYSRLSISGATRIESRPDSADLNRCASY